MKIKGFKMTKSLQREIDTIVELMEDPWAFEKYCGTCDNFQTDACPFRDRVDDETEWKKIGCKKFWD